ncbi:MAG: NAD(P)-binding domain-containing protein, partial [Syntrophaceae bacterium]|nr:NAD(P)-binding domain-containing protein [Syntrophaceae bacterium]
MRKEKIAIIGLGKAGTAIGYHLRRAGYPVVAVTGRSRATLVELSRYTGGEGFMAGANADAAKRATCVFITTPDDRIASVCRQIARQGGFRPGTKVVHMSGAGGLDLLEAARRAGARVACIHPIQSFADAEAAIRNLPGSTFG